LTFAALKSELILKSKNNNPPEVVESYLPAHFIPIKTVLLKNESINGPRQAIGSGSYASNW
jgi:hypothetical protein